MAIPFSSLKEDALPYRETYAATRREDNGRDPQNVLAWLDKEYNGYRNC
jgi:hypothetical protein